MIVADVAVVGGGPAGAAAAIALARAGRDVVLVDKARFPRDKTCGDGLTTAALRRLEHLGLHPGDVASWHVVGDAVVRAPGGAAVRFPLPSADGVYAAVAPRRELDAALLDVARSAGVKVHDGHALLGARVDHDRGAVDLRVAGLGWVSARYAIGADGMWSPLRKALGVTDGPYLGDWHAVRQYVAGLGPAGRDLVVWFERDLLPGYAWSFPLPGGRANVGFGVLRQAGRPTGWLKQAWPELLARPHVQEVLAGGRPDGPLAAWPIPARIERTSLTAGAGRVLFAGDAARAADPMTGEGIGQALETGTRAAECVLAAGPGHPWAAAARYERSIAAGLAVDSRLARALGRMLASPAGADLAVRVAGASPWTRRNFARWLFEDYPRAVAATPARWHRGVFSGPGAFRTPQLGAAAR